jgi:hypothetical protein
MAALDKHHLTPGGEPEGSLLLNDVGFLSRQAICQLIRATFRATEEVCLMKRIYKLTVIEEREEVSSKPPGIFRKSGWLLVRIVWAIAAWFHWGHS